MTLRYRFICSTCARYDFHEGAKRHCAYCSEELSKLRTLQRKIVNENPGYARVPMSELFERMYEKVMEK